MARRPQKRGEVVRVEPLRVALVLYVSRSGAEFGIGRGLGARGQLWGGALVHGEGAFGLSGLSDCGGWFRAVSLAHSEACARWRECEKAEGGEHD